MKQKIKAQVLINIELEVDDDEKWTSETLKYCLNEDMQDSVSIDGYTGELEVKEFEWEEVINDE